MSRRVEFLLFLFEPSNFNFKFYQHISIIIVRSFRFRQRDILLCQNYPKREVKFQQEVVQLVLNEISNQSLLTWLLCQFPQSHAQFYNDSTAFILAFFRTKFTSRNKSQIAENDFSDPNKFAPTKIQSLVARFVVSSKVCLLVLRCRRKFFCLISP